MDRKNIKVPYDELKNINVEDYDIIHVLDYPVDKLTHISNIRYNDYVRRDYLFDLILNIKYTTDEFEEAYDVGFFMLGNYDYIFEFIDACDIVIINDVFLKRKLLNLNRKEIKYTTKYFEKIIL